MLAAHFLCPPGEDEFLPRKADTIQSGQFHAAATAPVCASINDWTEILSELSSGVEGGFQKLLGIFPGISVLEYGAPGAQDLTACVHDVRYGIVVHSAVDFNPKFETARLPDF